MTTHEAKMVTPRQMEGLAAQNPESNLEDC